jgi:hypothetical protein
VLVPDVSKEALGVIDKIGTKEDDASNNVLYKYDADCCVVDHYDSTGYVNSDYYFWAVGDNLISTHGMTLGEIKNRLANYSSPYAILSTIAGSTDTLPVRYKSVILNKIKYVADKADTYKIKFNIRHYLRKFESDLERKNIHTEWKLIKRTMIDQLPIALWTKFVDSIVGETLSGVIIPAAARTRYDKKHGTNIQYGFGDEQTLLKSSDGKVALIYYVQQLDKYTDGGINVEGFDIDDFISNIDDATVTRKYLNVLYDKMPTTQLNSLFFDIIELGLAYGFVFTDLMKSSYVSIVSNKELKVFE